MPRAGCAMEVLFGRRFTRPAPAVLLVAIGRPGVGGFEGLALNPLAAGTVPNPECYGRSHIQSRRARLSPERRIFLRYRRCITSDQSVPHSPIALVPIAA
jgi:hypothetical protein